MSASLLGWSTLEGSAMSFTDSRHLLWLPPVFQVLGTSKSCAIWHQMSRGLRPHDGDQSGQLYIGGLLMWSYLLFLHVDK